MRDPGSLWSPLPESGRQGTGRKDKFVVHSTGGAADTAESIFRYFSRADIVVESTFIVGKTPADPTRQILDSVEVADANLGANTTAIAVEVCGSGDEPFTDWQVSELIRLGIWAAANHPIARVVVPTPTGSGFGWHVMFGSPGPWTPAVKVCPGARRIAQLKATIFPAIFAGTKPAEDDLPYTEKQLQDQVYLATRNLFLDMANGDNDLAKGAFLKLLREAAPAPGGVDVIALADQIVGRISARLAE